MGSEMCIRDRFLIKWAPLCLEVVHVKVHVFLHKVNDSRLDVSDGVSERAKLSVLAEVKLFREFCTEFCLVFLLMVESFNPVVSQLARLLKLVKVCAPVVCFSVLAKVRVVVPAILSSLILDAMVVLAVLVVVLEVHLAWIDLEFIQDKMLQTLHLHLI